MRNAFKLSLPALFLMISAVGAQAAPFCGPGSRVQDKDEVKQSDIKPEIAALVREATAAYKKMKTYRHTAHWSFSMQAAEGELRDDLNFTLALDRPNRFVYRLENRSSLFGPVNASCDGKTFINLKSEAGHPPQYTRTKAPDAYKGINIVDDVSFHPLGTYLIALMLQGDLMADHEVKEAFMKATLKDPVTENGKKWIVVNLPFGPDETVSLIYFSADDHRIGKTVQKGSSRVTELIDGVKVDKPIEATLFQYTTPANAVQVERFSGPQRPGDARRDGGLFIARR